MKSHLLLLILALCYINYAYGSTTICANGFKRVNNKCWKLYDGGQSRDNAQATCGRDGGALLAEIESSDLNNEFLNFLKISNHDEVWFGLKCRSDQKSGCQWDDLDSVGFSNFAKGNPTNKAQCVSFQTGAGHWTTHDCSDGLSFVCELPTTTQDCGSNCGANFNNHCYHPISSSLTFDDAQNHCKSMGTNMASIHSFGEYVFVARQFQNKGNYWLGGKMPEVNKITWLDGTPNDFHFSDSRVLDGPCMQFEVLSSGFGGKWLGKNCGYKTNFICKRAVKPC